LDDGEDFGVEGVEFMEAKSSSTLIVFSLPYCDISVAKKYCLEKPLISHKYKVIG
jgi:hypothetical protein